MVETLCAETGRHVKDEPVELSPQIIVGGSALECVLRTVFVEHSLEDHHVTGSHVDDLKTDIVGVGVDVVMATPFAAGNKRHGSFIGNIGC